MGHKGPVCVFKAYVHRDHKGSNPMLINQPINQSINPSSVQLFTVQTMKNEDTCLELTPFCNPANCWLDSARSLETNLTQNQLIYLFVCFSAGPSQCLILMHGPCIFYCFYYNQCTIIQYSSISLHNVHSYIFWHFCHHQGILYLYLAKLHIFLKLQLLILQFHKIKYIKILSNHCLVIQQNLFDCIISCASSVFVAAYTVPCWCAGLTCTSQ